MLKYKTGTIYQGNFSKGVKHGFGHLITGTGYVYRGDWSSGCRSGYAQIHYENGDSYIGEVVNGLRSGEGELHISASGETLQGYWREDNIIGTVKIDTADWQFKGQFVAPNNSMVGEIVYADKSSYIGEMFNFRRFGNGALTTSAGDPIIGLWANEVDVNDAKRVDRKGVIWRGTLRDLKPHGLIRIELPNGAKYDGHCEDGKIKRFLSIRNCEGPHAPYVLN